MPRGKKVSLSLSEIDFIKTSYLAGKSTRDISKDIGVCYQKISEILKKEGITLDRNSRISEKAKGRPSPRKGSTHTEETKLKISSSRKGKAVTIGYKYTEEQKKTLSISRKKYISNNPNWNYKLIQASKNRAMPKEQRDLINNQRSSYKRLLSRLLKITSSTKVSKTEIYLGYSKQEFIKHIESRFTQSMSWEDRSSFHIDHKIPVSILLKYGITDPKVVNSLDNLQPLPPLENMLKSNKISQQEVFSFLEKQGILL